MDYQTILLAIDIWREARNQTYKAMLGVGWVVKNRAAHPGWWGNTIVQVITHRWQFSSMTAPGDPNLVDWPQENDPTWKEALQAATNTVKSVESDPTDGATYYYSLPLINPPAEWGLVIETCVIDDLTFCKAVS